MKKAELEKQITKLQFDNARLCEAYELLLKSLPIIHLRNPIKDLNNEKTQSLIDLAVKGSATLIKTIFDLCELKTHIDSTVIFGPPDEKFKLTFTKIDQN